MPSGDSFSREESKYGELLTITYYQPYYVCPPPEEDSSDESVDFEDDDIEEKIDELSKAFSRLTISSSSSSSSSLSSMTLMSIRPLDALLEQLAIIAREAADRSECEVHVPQEILDRVVELHLREEISQNPQFAAASDSQHPINVYINPTPQGRGYWKVSSIAAFFIIILVIRAGSQY